MLISIKSRSNLKLSHVRSNTRSLCQILEKPVNTLEGTVLIQRSLNFVRMLIIIHSRPDLKLGHVGSNTRSGLRKPCVHSRGHGFDPRFMKLCQKYYEI